MTQVKDLHKTWLANPEYKKLYSELTETTLESHINNIDLDAFRKLLFRKGGEPPREGDEVKCQHQKNT